MGSNNQKEIKYVSHSNIRASVETRPPKLFASHLGQNVGLGEG